MALALLVTGTQVIAQNLPVSARVLERGRNHNVLEAGTVRVTVLANGLNRLDEFGNWIKAEPELAVVLTTRS